MNEEEQKLEINIKAESVEELQLLGDYLAGRQSQRADVIPVETVQIAEAEPKTRTRKTEKPELSLIKDPEPEEAPAQEAPKEGVNIVTQMSLRMKFSELIAKGMQKQVTDLLASVNADKISAVPEGELAQLFAKAEAILNA